MTDDDRSEPHFYVLDGHEPVPVDDALDWGRWLEVADEARTVAVTRTPAGTVSTVFLGLNHRFGPGPPLLFETMIFGGKRDQAMWRYSTWAEAEAGHAAAVAALEDAGHAD